MREQLDTVFDVAIIGGNLAGSMAATMLARRGLEVCVLEARPPGRPQKVVVGEALTEGSSVFLRHELGLGPWLGRHAFRKFGFDFLVLPRTGPAARTMEDCHELLLSLTPLEQIPGALRRLIPTYHVERTALNAHLGLLARSAGATVLEGASVERVDLAAGASPHELSYVQQGASRRLRCRFVLDASGRRAVLGRQLGITHPLASLDTASVWNRFTAVNADPRLWQTFHGVDRRRHTIHFSGQGFWIWWIHQSDQMTSVGVSYDRAQHQPDVKAADHGFWEMLRKFPPAAAALAGARPLEPYQHYAHLPYRSEHWISPRGYALIGDAAWFTDALYSIGIETACRQLAAAAPSIVELCRGRTVAPATFERWNQDFAYCQEAVARLNEFKYRHGWHRPHVLMQTALYELGEIAELYHLQDSADWRPEVLDRHFRLQWSSARRLDRLERFQSRAIEDGDRDLVPGARLLKKALLPGWLIYRSTWPLWKLRGAAPYFFHLVRGWAYSERLCQRSQAWPDGLAWLASPRRLRDLRSLARLPAARDTPTSSADVRHHAAPL